MRWLNPLSVRARLALGIIPLIFLVTSVALMVDRGFSTVAVEIDAFEASAQVAADFELMERCLAGSQRSLLRFVADRAPENIAAFQTDVSCMTEIAEDMTPALVGPLGQYRAAFEDVVRLSKEEADLREEVTSHGPLAIQTLTSIIAQEIRVGDFETALLAASIKDKILESLFLLDGFLSGDVDSSALDLVQEARDMKAAFMSRLSLPLQIERGETVFAQLDNYSASAVEAKDTIASRELIERFMLDAIAAHVEAAIIDRTTDIQNRRSALGSAIGVSLQRTQEQVLLLSVVALSVGVLLVMLVGHWVSGTINKLARLMTRVANGDFDAEVPGASWTNEFGEMARSLRTFQENSRKRLQAEEDARAARVTAETDLVTGLGNRRAIDRHIAGLSAAALEQSSVVLIDLNSFKPINDSYGHDAGDTVLQVIGSALKQAMGRNGVAVRLGGDEFGLLIEAACDQASLVGHVERFLDVFEQPIDYHGAALRIGASVGIARLRDVGGDIEAAWKAADKAMYSVKTTRATGFAIHDPDTEADPRSAVPPNQIQEALHKGEFEPFFQPQFDLETGIAVGFEVLARWRHPEFGLLCPGQFLDRVEELGHTYDFTHSLLSRALSCLKEWRDAGLNPPPVVVTLQETYLSASDSAERLMALIEECALSASDFVLAVAEDTLVSRTQDKTMAAILRLSDYGCGISVDGFGAGSCSLLHLDDLPLQEAKIDRAFVRRIGTSGKSEAIIDAMIALADALGIRLIADGIERADQIDFLLSRGCRYGQGEIQCPAVEAQKIPSLLATDMQIKAHLQKKWAV